MCHNPLPTSICLSEVEMGTEPSFDAIREGTIRTGLDFFQTGQPFIPCYVANGWLGGCCDEFGFHSRPQFDMDHGRTGLGYQMHYVRRYWGGHDLVQLAHLQATYADGRAPGLAGLESYHQELDLFTASLETNWSCLGSRWSVRTWASWAVPQLYSWCIRQASGRPEDHLHLRLCFDTAAADNNARNDSRLHLQSPVIRITVLNGKTLSVSSTTNCRTTTLLVFGDGLDLHPEETSILVSIRDGSGTLKLLVLDQELAPDIAADPAAWLVSQDHWAGHLAAVARRWSSGVIVLPPGPAAQVWLRSRYYAIASLPPYSCHIQDPTGLCANIWGHGFPQDQYYVVEALPRLGLADIARVQMPVWGSALPEVLRYTRRLAGVEGAFYPWIPPFEDWGAFEVKGPTNPDSYEFHNSAYVSAMVMGIYRYTGDRCFLEEYLPLLREIARFYVAITRLPEKGGAYIEHPLIRSQDEAMATDHHTRHPLCCLWSATYALRSWLEARRQLGDVGEPVLADQAGAILARHYDLDGLRRPEGGLKTCQNDPRPAGQQKHPVQLNPIALLPMPDLMSDPDVHYSWNHRLDLCHNARIPFSAGWTFGLFSLASARMRDGKALAADLALVQPARYADGRWIQFYESSCRNGWQHKKAYYFTTSGLYLQALTDAVIQDCRGYIDLCAALLPEWQGERIEVYGVTSLGGARIDGWYAAGRCRFTITPKYSGPVTVRMGLPGIWSINGNTAGDGATVTVEGQAGVALAVTRNG